MIKKIIYVLCVIVILVLSTFFFSFERITYTTTHIPPITYSIKINKFTKNMKVRTFNSCNGDGCVKKDTTNRVKLTNEEYDNIKKIKKETNNIEELSKALADLSKGDIPYVTKGQTEYETELDINNDEIITFRELALSKINELLNKKD